MGYFAALAGRIVPAWKSAVAAAARSAPARRTRKSGGPPVGIVPTPSPSAGPLDAPGRTGGSTTVEVDPGRLGPVMTTYNPVLDGHPDPGEVVWTWVPFAENDGRGKDRPVLIVAAESAGSWLAVQLTSKNHVGEEGFLPVGAGGWDAERRPSWANLTRVLRIQPAGMRRESIGLDRARFDSVTAALDRRYSWH